MIAKSEILYRLKSLYVKRQLSSENHLKLIYPLVLEYLTKIEKYSQEKHPIVFIAETNPLRFLSAFFAGIITESCLFLINPSWQQKEWEMIENLVIPDIILGEINYQFTDKKEKKYRFEGIMIATGGTSGKIKFAIHTWDTLTASAKGFYQYFDRFPINFYDCLPLYHVSGLMPIIRSLITEGSLIINAFSHLKKNLQDIKNYPDYFISLVPTQLQFFLDNQPEILQQFSVILVGGASIYPQQKRLARKYNLPLAFTYGMTETASGISILKPEEFKLGNNSNGHILPHANIIFNFEQKGEMTIESESLFKGYYPHYQELNYFEIDDIGYLDKKKYLHILGRNSQKIITGGENVFPLEIETAILETELVKDIYITSTKDNYWGEIITAFYVPINEAINEDNIKAKLKDLISGYKIPKIWRKLDYIPRNKQGKINQILFS